LHMKGSKFIDTNVFLRFFTADDPVQSSRARELIARLASGDIEGITSDLTVAEVVWVLDSHYGLPRPEIIKKVAFLLSLTGLRIPGSGMIKEALTLYEARKVDYIDAYNAAFMRHHGCSALYSYDRDFDRFGVVRDEP